MWRSAEIAGIECDADDEFSQCIVVLRITYRGFAMTADMTTDLPQRWVQVDGAWFTTVAE
jgi:hypothetical protein